ncbi:MAG: pyridoxamine 5'-phosphate oxidase family protein [Myxococcales bacterium]|nr:pyridoxamine 5'-phosphate oxidase family protein [Myxococcales bacterium]
MSRRAPSPTSQDALARAWPELRRLFGRAFASSRHVAIASLDDEGHPRVTPIGSFMLAPEVGRAFYFERFVGALRQGVERDPRVSILAVDSGAVFWLRSLAAGRFDQAPGVRLRGLAAPELRAATPAEVERFRRRVRRTRWTRGHELLWSELAEVRDVAIHAVEPVHLGRMTAALSGAAGRARGATRSPTA